RLSIHPSESEHLSESEHIHSTSHLSPDSAVIYPQQLGSKSFTNPGNTEPGPVGPCDSASNYLGASPKSSPAIGLDNSAAAFINSMATQMRDCAAAVAVNEQRKRLEARRHQPVQSLFRQRHLLNMDLNDNRLHRSLTSRRPMPRINLAQIPVRLFPGEMDSSTPINVETAGEANDTHLDDVLTSHSCHQSSAMLDTISPSTVMSTSSVPDSSMSRNATSLSEDEMAYYTSDLLFNTSTPDNAQPQNEARERKPLHMTTGSFLRKIESSRDRARYKVLTKATEVGDLDNR
ncbi:unnamed protein product, partial [Protopolystoma xenopodis]